MWRPPNGPPAAETSPSTSAHRLCVGVALEHHAELLCVALAHARHRLVEHVLQTLQQRHDRLRKLWRTLEHRRISAGWKESKRDGAGMMGMDEQTVAYLGFSR